jgi:putative lipoprotein
MRTISGIILLPSLIDSSISKMIIIEIRDTSLADAPSTIVCEKRLTNIRLSHNGKIKFNFVAPEVDFNRTVSLRVHISIDGTGIVKKGDLLTTAFYKIPNSGKVTSLEIKVQQI